MALLGLSYPEKAMLASRGSLACARGLTHPPSLLLAWSFASQFELLAGDVEAVLAHGNAMAALRAATDIPTHQDPLYSEWVRASAGEEGLLATSLRSIAVYRARGQEREAPAWFALLAKDRRKAGRADEGLHLLKEVLGRIERTREG
jgi:hypothetical protein